MIYDKKITDGIILSCKKTGTFVLHSGDITDHIYDVMVLIDNEMFLDELEEFVWENVKDKYIVGIEFGGAILVAYLGNSGILSYQKFGLVRKDGNIYGSIPENYVLLDDVVTTENSILQSIKHIGKEPSTILCVVDRRKEKTLDIKSMYEDNIY